MNTQKYAEGQGWRRTYAVPNSDIPTNQKPSTKKYIPHEKCKKKMAQLKIYNKENFVSWMANHFDPNNSAHANLVPEIALVLYFNS